MKKLTFIVGFCFVSYLLQGQLSFSPISKNLSQLKSQKHIDKLSFSKSLPSPKYLAGNYAKGNTTRQQSQPLAYAYKDLAFFCKIEVQLEKSIKMPIKFRLGSVDYVDYLEKKRDSY